MDGYRQKLKEAREQNKRLEKELNASVKERDKVLVYEG